MISRLDLTSLRETVQRALDQGRIGTPRFLRCIARADSPGELGRALDDLVSLGEAWFGSPPVQRHMVGSDGGAYVSEMLKWPEGQGAIIAVTSAPTKGFPQFDLMLVGSRGTLYHEM